MPILDENVSRYFQGLRPERSAVMAEMEALAEHEHVPIVAWETGRFLAALVRANDPELVLEVGTAIGYSTLHMAEALKQGRIVTIERDSERVGQARRFLERGGVGDRVEIVEADALDAVSELDGPFDFIFLDATKTEYPDYLKLAEPKASERAVLVIDNMLMFGEVALPEGADTVWSSDKLETARSMSHDLLRSDKWLGVVLPIGDGVAFAARR